MKNFERFIILLFIPIAIFLAYYVGLITLSKLKIKQSDDALKTHFLRILFGFLTLAAITAIFLLLKSGLHMFAKFIYEIK